MKKTQTKERNQLTLRVKKSRSKERYKNNILSALYESNEVQKKVIRICERNRIPRNTYIHEDITNEVFYQLSSKNPDYIIEMYEDNPSRLLGLAVVIGVRKGVGCLHNKTICPRQSIAKELLFTSVLNNNITLSPIEDNHYIRTLEDTDKKQEIWNDIEYQLSNEDKELINELYVRKETKKRGALTKEHKIKYQQLLHKIKQIING